MSLFSKSVERFRISDFLSDIGEYPSAVYLTDVQMSINVANEIQLWRKLKPTNVARRKKTFCNVNKRRRQTLAEGELSYLL